jgi:SAM-dependent methyltransferase
MAERSISEEDLARLKRERDEANERYTTALTALDQAKQVAPEVPAPPPGPDEHVITPLNEQWTILASRPGTPAGWRARFADIAWQTVGPILERQQVFNALLVEHINRSLVVDRETRESIATTIQLAREQFGALVTFEWRLMHYLQQLTPYVDAADRESAALLRRANEDTAWLLEVYRERLEQAIEELRGRATMADTRLANGEQMVRGFAAGLAGVSDELQKRWESMVAREQRLEARTSGLPILQQAVQSMRREIERLIESGQEIGRGVAPGAPEKSGGSGRPPTDRGAVFTSTEAYKYVCFEEKFRGARHEIAGRVADYVPLFAGASDVLDIGCGRGEFLEALGSAGISARGVDLNPAMVETCRARGLTVEVGDALTYVRGLADESLGGIFAAQVVEHLSPDYLVSLLDQAFHKLRAGATIVLETINPSCWFAFFESYLRDLTHVQPIHPDTLSFLLQASGFQRVDIQFRSPLPEEERLEPVTGDDAIARAFNANVDRLNRRLFSYLDYAAIGKK